MSDHPDPRSSERTPRYAVIFRTHSWDEFTARQLARLLKTTAAGDIFILVNETNGRVEGLDAHEVFRLRDADVLAAGYVDGGGGPIQWMSGDVPVYLFRQAHPQYEYYVYLDYDVYLTASLDQTLRRIAEDQVDMVALTKGEAPEDWYWRDTCLELYPIGELRHQLICFSVFSGSALDRLSAVRLRHAQAYRNEEIGTWPICEGFLASEALKQGLTVRELSDYGDVQKYDWWPRFCERDLRQAPEAGFMHPVLDSKRYVQSLFRHGSRLQDFTDCCSASCAGWA